MRLRTLPAAPLRAAALAALFLAAPAAHADPVGWAYTWDVTPKVLTGDPGSTGSVTFTPPPAGSAAAGNSTVVAAALSALSSASPSHPDTFSGQGYTLKLTLTDDTSGQSGVLTFAGKLFGSMSAASSNITNAFTAPLTQSLTLGGHTYTVTIGPFVAPGGPMEENKGAVSAQVAVGPTVSNAPEPSSLLLAALGLPLAAAVRRRRHAGTIR
jgi:hypothetical protein